MGCRSWNASLAIVALISVAGMAVLVWRRLEDRPFAEQGVVSVAMTLHGPPFSQMAAEAETSESAAVSELTAMLDRGRPTEPHPCESVGALLLKRADGSELTVHLLHGHDSQMLEYSYDGVYRRVARRDLLQAVSPFWLPAGSFFQPLNP